MASADGETASGTGTCLAEGLCAILAAVSGELSALASPLAPRSFSARAKSSSVVMAQTPGWELGV